MTTLFVKRVGNALHADGDESLGVLAGLPFGKSFRADIKLPRNARYHRWYFAICNRIANGVGSDAETIANIFKYATGHVEVVKTKSYGEVRIPKSISFAKMDDISFRVFVEKCIQCAYEQWQIDPADLADLLAPMEGQKTK